MWMCFRFRLSSAARPICWLQPPRFGRAVKNQERSVSIAGVNAPLPSISYVRPVPPISQSPSSGTTFGYRDLIVDFRGIL